MQPQRAETTPPASLGCFEGLSDVVAVFVLLRRVRSRPPLAREPLRLGYLRVAHLMALVVVAAQARKRLGPTRKPNAASVRFAIA